jgi:nucleoside 2-deoxyribosyltransferase
MRTFLICPVRGHDPEETRSIVESLEQNGYEVHWPPRDTDQDDPTAFRICCDNLEAIHRADCVHVVWDGKSQGCLFDLGMAFALDKRVYIVRLPEATEGKSFQNMVRRWNELTLNYGMWGMP